MSSSTVQKLRQIMQERFTIENVIPEYRDRFESDIRGMIGTVDADIERFKDPDKQRDLSIKFTWGHDHDFGSFSLHGSMGNRHIDIIADFIDTFGLPPDLRGKKILDIGVWTGGTCLVLCALGAEVVGLEEVVKYSNALGYLAEAFDLSQQLQARSISLYSFDEHDVYDYILYPGVIYHVTDPVLSLRILFNALKDGGKIFVETFGIKISDQAPPIAMVEGPSVIRGGNKDNLTRGGWNYYIPSPKALYLWLDSVGFHDVKVGPVDQESRIRAVATRTQHEDMLRAGLSRPGIR